MEFNPSLPIYLQVITMIQREIVLGILPMGARMPSVRELAIQYTINPNTASRVYKELENEGICFTKRGMGTFVTENGARVQQLKTEMAQELIHQFLDGMQQLGISEEEAIQMLKKENHIFKGGNVC